MFLISFSENILFSLGVEKRGREGRKDGQKRNKERTVKKKINPTRACALEVWNYGQVLCGKSLNDWFFIKNQHYHRNAENGVDEAVTRGWKTARFPNN